MLVFHCFAGRKMDLPALLQRMYTLGEKPPALRRALNADEYEELKELVYYMLSFQLNIKKKC
ncbi:unnamed protein product [Brassica oleracea]